jgi:hypothetical protein
MWRSVLSRAALILALLFAPVAAYLWLPAIGTPSPKALQYSVAREVGSDLALDVGTCREVEQSGWRCEVFDGHGSEMVTYALALDGRCWRAVKRTNGEEGPPLANRASACVRWRDQLRLYQRLA